MVSNQKRIVIIGGGISGISAALHATARAPEAEVLLLESSSRVGGVLETLKFDNYLIERSADNFATLIPNARDLSEKFGLLPSLIQPNSEGRQAFVYSAGRAHPIPAGFSLMQPTRVLSILTTRVLSLRGKIRLLGEYWAKQRPDSISDESLESFAIRRLGKEAFDRLVEPIVSGIFTANPKTLSMAATMPQFLQMEREHGGLIRGYLASKRQDAAAAARRASGARYDQFMAPREGMSSWINALASKLPEGCVRLQTSATGLQKTNDQG
ncbi:MAG: protoporphyrinogen oxidase [Pirellulales bacterium]